MSEPDYLAQTAENLTPQERHAWIQERVHDAREKGCEIVRASVDPKRDPMPTLVEGWIDPQADQSVPPHWRMTTD